MPCFDRKQVNIVKNQGDLVSTGIWCVRSIAVSLEENKTVVTDIDTW